jgi:GT2 family glycosyltransferase
MDHAAAPLAQRIFVGIPSYRDAETQWTVEDLFLRAERPERVTVGICWQLEPGDEASCFERPSPRPGQVSEVRFAAGESRGSTWARAQALALAGDEEFVLMIDAHMRFADGWDRRLIERLLEAPGANNALTGWLPAYLPPKTLQPAPEGMTWLIGASELMPAEHPSVLRLGPVAVPRDDVPPLALTPFVVGNFVFARRAMFDRVPFDPHVYMYGQEITLSARLWTHGWDLWQPRDPLLFHYWKPLEVHNADAYKHESGERVARTAARVRHLLGLERSHDPVAIADLERYGLGDVRPLEALWMASGVDPRRGTIAEVARQGRWNQSPRRPPPTRPRIFVNIPAYRDAETAPTLRDMFAQATHPERVFAGVCWQYVEGADPPHCADPSPRPGQVREVTVAADRSEGAIWARMQAFSLWQGEEYVLSIDAHTRFERGWDELLIGMLAQCPSDKPLLSTYPSSYKLPDARDRNGVLKMAFKEFVVESPGAPPKLMYQTHRIRPAALPARPFPTATVGNGFMFARAELFAEVPFDPHIYFFGDDLSFSTRAWTSGWDIFSPNRPVIFHLWDRSQRPGHWRDEPKRSSELRLRTERRVAHLVGIEPTADREALVDLDRYGLGTVRSIAAYQAFSGVDFSRRTVSERARRGDFGDAGAAEADDGAALGERLASRPRIFVSIPSYRDPETQWTIKDLFEKAADPDAISVGICWQFVEGDDADCFIEPAPRPAQVRTVNVAAERSQGSCWARAQAMSLWRGEEFVLAIDAHTRFEPRWDELLLETIAACPGEKPVLTTYPNDYTGRDDCDRNGVLRMAVRGFVVDRPGLPPRLAYDSVRILPDALPPRPFATALVSVNFLFARSDLFTAVPFDPHVYFYDDLAFAARAWTSGWNFHSPHRNVLFHLWDRSKRPAHWSDQAALAERRRELTLKRVSHLLGIERSDDREALVDLESYGLGAVRSLRQYEEFSGIDFVHRTVAERAKRGEVAPASLVASTPTARGRASLVLRTQGAMVIDDFLPEAQYEELFDYASRMDYQYINTSGTVRRVWDLSSGFPLRSEKNLFVHAPHATTREGNFHYPSGTPLDPFVDAIQAAIADVGAMVGRPRPDGWHHFSVTSWIYPPNTALSMHDDGAGVYSGAYVYYLNPEWKPHWGGLLIVLDDAANKAIAARKQGEADGQAFYARKWLHLAGHDELALEHGLGRCIFPKKNRIVFIAPDAYHLVTRVLPEAGDNARMSLAGFFHRRASATGGG